VDDDSGALRQRRNATGHHAAHARVERDERRERFLRDPVDDRARRVPLHVRHERHVCTMSPSDEGRTTSNRLNLPSMSDPLPLSLIVITRDAAVDLAACIASAPFAAETVVVDSGSRDDTVAVARRAGARVVDHAFEGYGAQKNFAVAQAAHDWVLCIDADERVSPALADAIRALFATGAPAAAGYAMARRNRFLGRWLSHGEG
jgi:hypothetical protein